MPTTNPVPSTDPSDLLFNAGKLDEVVNSTAPTYTDRMGVERRTLTALEDEFPNAAANAAAAAESATQAANEAMSAATAVDLAFAEATAAQAARTGAEAARDAAQLSAGVYATTAAGLAATTNGQYFSVPSGASSEYLILYQNSSGTAVEIKRYPAAAALDPLQNTNNSIFAVEDADGNMGVSVESSFRVTANGAVETSSHQTSKQVHRYRWAVADNDGNIAIGVNDSGQLVADFSFAPIPSSYKTGGTYDYEVNHVFNYGQSLSVGQAAPAISTTQSYDNLMFVRGMRPQYDYPAETAAQWYASLQPAIEAQSPTQSILAETPSMGTGDSIKERILVEDGLAYNSMSYQLLLSAPGYGATNISQLSKGTTHYNRMVEQAQYGLALANAANKTYAVQAVTWTQGESDYISGTTQAAYVTALNTLIADINTDIKAATGQTKNIPVIGYQIASHKVYSRTTPNIALGQLEVEGSNPLVYIATPMYHFAYAGAADAHLTNVSSRWLGAYYGLAYKRIVIDGVDWKPLKPLSSMKQGKTAVIKFHVPVGRLVLDTTLVAANTNYGFELVDSVGAALTISSIAVIGPDTVKVVAAATIPAGAKLRYAWSGSGTVGSSDGPRGNLRDTQGDSIVFDPTGINKPMHNWCVIFELSL